MAILALGINHKTAPVAVRERVAFSPDRAELVLADLMSDKMASEAAILSTCNRTEVYCSMADAIEERALVDWLCAHHNMPAKQLLPCLYSHWNEAAAAHVMRVASGLDSMVLGEPQIFGQLKRAYGIAQKASSIGPELGRLFRQAFTVAKRVRTQTGIGASPVSVASAAVTLAHNIFSEVRNTHALLIGAGETIDLAARHLRSAGVTRMTVANRTLSKAQTLATEMEATAIRLEAIPDALLKADIVISSTGSPLPILGKGAVEKAIKARKHRPIFMVDIAVPRDIEPEVGRLADVYLYTVDDLKEIIDENVRSRQDAAQDAEAIVSAGAAEFMRELKALEAVSTLKAFRSQTERLKQLEMQRALSALKAGEDPEAVLQLLAHNLTNKWLHTPSVRMREASAEGRPEVLDLVQELFGLNDFDVADKE